MDRIECEIDRWEGRHNNKKHMKEIQAEQKRHYTNNHNAEASRKHPHHFTRERPNRKILSEKQDNCNNWECFYEEQKKNTVLPTIGNMLRTLDDGSWRQKLRRIKDHKRGNTKVGVSNHTAYVTPETKRPKSARAA